MITIRFHYLPSICLWNTGLPVRARGHWFPSDILSLKTGYFHRKQIKEGRTKITWDQALFSFRFENYILAGIRRNIKRAWYKPFTKHLLPTFLIDCYLLISPSKLLQLLLFLVCKFFICGKNADLLTWKIALIFKFFQLKIKRSAQSHLTSWEIKGDLEGYFCWRRR